MNRKEFIKAVLAAVVMGVIQGVMIGSFIFYGASV